MEAARTSTAGFGYVGFGNAIRKKCDPVPDLSVKIAQLNTFRFLFCIFSHKKTFILMFECCQAEQLFFMASFCF